MQPGSEQPRYTCKLLLVTHGSGTGVNAATGAIWSCRMTTAATEASLSGQIAPEFAGIVTRMSQPDASTQGPVSTTDMVNSYAEPEPASAPTTVSADASSMSLTWKYATLDDHAMPTVTVASDVTVDTAGTSKVGVGGRYSAVAKAFQPRGWGCAPAEPN